jgi:hypothetical protein
MGTKRTPRNRPQRPVVSVAAVEAWQRALALKYPRPGWQDVAKALATALGISWVTDMSPLDVTTETPPDYIARNPALAPDWARAWRLRCALVEAERAMSSKAEAAAGREQPE